MWVDYWKLQIHAEKFAYVYNARELDHLKQLPRHLAPMKIHSAKYSRTVN